MGLDSVPRASWMDSHLVRGESTAPVIVFGAAIVLFCVIAASSAALTHWSDGDEPIALRNPRVVVLKKQRLLHLFDGDRLVRTYPVDLGVNPVGAKHTKDDGQTPEGVFRVVAKRSDSPFYRFIGIDYPDMPTCDWGLGAGLISPGEAEHIRQALDAGHCPDWSTTLGGGIGLHGHRKGWDWTGGCVAVADEHIEVLFNVLRSGDRIEILP